MNESASTCQLAATTTTTTVPVCAKRNVCYEFDTRATKADLTLPYLVIVNGEVQGGNRPRKLSGANRRINITVDAGSRVALYLNSDVHFKHRCNAVYEVVAHNHDVLVKITEQIGQHDAAPVVERSRIISSQRVGAASIEQYTAKLTGDIWKLISHKYSEAEANDLLPNDTESAIRRAVCAIYRGLAAPRLDMPLSGEGEVLRVSFIRQLNPETNITRCSLLSDVLPRTHPLAFAAMFTAARKARLSQLHITSCWRPSLGSIAHRAGLGLDASLIANPSRRISLNRGDLRAVGPSRNQNITDREKELRRAADEKAAIAERNRHDNSAAEQSAISQVAWEQELRSSQPALMQEVRQALRAQPIVQQILDPWYMELNTRRTDSLTGNAQINSNERLHKDHLHITITDPDIYE